MFDEVVTPAAGTAAPPLRRQLEPVGDQRCGLLSGGDVGVDLEIDRRLLDAVAIVAEPAQRAQVGQLVELLTVLIADPPLLLHLGDDQTYEADPASTGLDSGAHPGREAKRHGGLWCEGESQGAADTSGLGEHLQPELLAQPHERLTPEGKDRGQRVDHQVVVEHRVAQKSVQSPGGGQLARGCRAVQEDQLHRPRLAQPAVTTAGILLECHRVCWTVWRPSA